MMQNRLPPLTYLFLVWLGFLSAPSLGQTNASDKPLVFAGFAFAGNYENRSSLYPYTTEIIEKGKPGFIDDLLREKLNARSELRRKVTLQKVDSKQDLTSVACALVQENVEFQKVDGKVIVVVLMQANVLAFSKMTNSIVASYPLRMRFTRTRNVIPNSSDLRSIVLEAYTSANPDENLLDQWLNKLETASFKEGATKYLRITDINIAPEADAVLQKAGVKGLALKNQVANLLEASLADKSGVPIVPNSVGEAIGNKMPLRFASSTALNITLPEPDYAVSFVIRGFASKTVENPQSFTDIFRTKGTLAIKLPETGRVYLEENLYDTKFVTRPKQADVQLTEWDQYNKTLQSLVWSLGKQLVNVDDTWLKEHAARAEDAKPAFLQAKQLFQELK